MKKIAVSDLKIGDKVLKLDKEWVETSIFRHRFIVKDTRIVQKLEKNGIEYVFIEGDAGSEVSEAIGSLIEDQEEHLSEIHEKIIRDSYIDISNYRSGIELYKESVRIVHEILDDVREGRALDTESVRQVATGITDAAYEAKNVLPSISKLKNFDKYIYQHSLNVSIFAVSLARHIGLKKEYAEILAASGIVHDVGKMLIPDSILNKPSALTDDEYELVKTHVNKGVEILQNAGFEEDYLYFVREHHERHDGSGYPNGLKDSEISLFGKIGAVVDIYDAITSDRVYNKKLEANSALQLMFKWTDTQINKKIFDFFVANIGIFPVGTLVLLNTNELALIGKVNQGRPGEPVVVVFMDGKGNSKPPFTVDLMKPVTRRRKIVGPVNPETVDIPQEAFAVVEKMNTLLK